MSAAKAKVDLRDSRNISFDISVRFVKPPLVNWSAKNESLAQDVSYSTNHPRREGRNISIRSHNIYGFNTREESQVQAFILKNLIW